MTGEGLPGDELLPHWRSALGGGAFVLGWR